MPSRNYYYTGYCNWAKVYPGQEDKKYGHFGLDFYPDDPEDFFKSGIQLQERRGDDEKVFVQLRRKPQQMIKGELVTFGSPLVLDKENQPFDKPIGNGSKVTVKVVVYTTVKGMGHRLESVRVEDWVEYNPDGGSSREAVNLPALPF